ncbi:hypothetical protein AUO94_10435 [Planococcus kocurii]|uniref:Iron-binding zinc finger CDGSH type domain-containing protein n=1 Tax=Planococcus kocurii TaxID=1374 RepID=A0ABM5WXG9_9BACL|nr:hypothetical protein AUO94_10435 [Planococcus kocurii]
MNSFLVAADGTGPLADAELHFEWFQLFKIEEGWNRELKLRPFWDGAFFCGKKEKRRWPFCSDRHKVDFRSGAFAAQEGQFMTRGAGHCS